MGQKICIYDINRVCGRRTFLFFFCIFFAKYVARLVFLSIEEELLFFYHGGAASSAIEREREQKNKHHESVLCGENFSFKTKSQKSKIKERTHFFQIFHTITQY